MFKIGDRVELIKPFGLAQKGLTGTVLVNDDSGFGISFDGFNRGHSLDGNAKNNSGYWIAQDYVKKLQPKHICKLVCNCDAREAISF